MVAMGGGVATCAPTGPAAESESETETKTETAESTRRAALIAEIRRLRTLVNESPVAIGVEAFDVEMGVGMELAQGRKFCHCPAPLASASLGGCYVRICPAPRGTYL